MKKRVIIKVTINTPTFYLGYVKSTKKIGAHNGWLAFEKRLNGIEHFRDRDLPVTVSWWNYFKVIPDTKFNRILYNIKEDK